MAVRKTALLKKELTELRTKQPFRPFRVVLKNGKHFTIGERLWYCFGGNTLVLLPSGGPSEILKFDQVDSVEVVTRKR